MSNPIHIVNNNLLGIVYIVLAIFMLASMDAVAKLLVTSEYSSFQILFLRGCINMVLLSALMPFMGGIRLVKTSRFWAHGLRGLFGFLAPLCFFTALTSMQLAEATVIFFIAPFVMTALSVPLFKEKVGIHRWGAIIVGFCGVLYVVQPTSDIFNPAVFLVLAASLFYCLLMLSSRWLGRVDPTFTIVFYVTFWVTLLSSTTVFFVWKDMPFPDLLAVAAMAVLSLAGNFFIVKAFTIGEVGAITPFEYTGLLWAVTFGFVFFGEVPGLNVWVGMAIIAASGLYMVYRENKKKPAIS
ncbi:DMT family transporter [Sneathiella glossodoripedis]|uniref:DMT family transporter n=1 Tax=Sneathiella glossodoripedis TaxID=418853 RepID=UPI0004712571|nr:DMT family transporter [Sneathiella glossodoripedis]